jgi:hypothetical protein
MPRSCRPPVWWKNAPTRHAVINSKPKCGDAFVSTHITLCDDTPGMRKRSDWPGVGAASRKKAPEASRGVVTD